MNKGYFKDFVDGFMSGETTHLVLRNEIVEYGEHNFFLDLYLFLREMEESCNFKSNDIYSSISLSYHGSSKYFEEH